MEPPATPRTKKASRDLPGFADALRRSMRARGYTQTMLAEDLGVTQSMVSTWVNGLYAPNPALIATIEQTLNQRAGTLTRFFGFVPSHDDTDNVGVIYAIRADPGLSEAQADALVALYEHFAGTP